MSEEKKLIILHENELLKLQKQQPKPKRKPKWMDFQDKKLFYSFELETPQIQTVQVQKKVMSPSQVVSQKLLEIGETKESLNFAYKNYKFPCCLVDGQLKMLWMNQKFEEEFKVKMEEVIYDAFLLEQLKNTQKVDMVILNKFLNDSEEKLELNLNDKNIIKFKKIFKGENTFGSFVTFDNTIIEKTNVEMANDLLLPTGLTHEILFASHGDKVSFLFTFNRQCMWMSPSFMKLAQKTEDDLLKFGILQKLLENNTKNESLMGVFVYIMKEKPKYYEILAEMNLPVGGKSKSRMLFERIDTLEGAPFGYLETSTIIYHLPIDRTKLANESLIKMDISYEQLTKIHKDYEDPIFLIDTKGKLYWGNEIFFLWIKKDKDHIVFDDLFYVLQLNQEFHKILEVIKYVLIFKPETYSYLMEMEKLKNIKSNINLQFKSLNLDGEVFGYFIFLNNVKLDFIKQIKPKEKAHEMVKNYGISLDHLNDQDEAKKPICMINLDFVCLWMNNKFKEYFKRTEEELCSRVLLQIFEKNTNLVEFITLCVKEKRNTFEVKLNTTIDKIIFETIFQNNELCGYYVIFYPKQ